MAAVVRDQLSAGCRQDVGGSAHGRRPAFSRTEISKFENRSLSVRPTENRINVVIIPHVLTCFVFIYIDLCLFTVYIRLVLRWCATTFICFFL